MSASSRPVFAPSRARPTASIVETVDLPTPPLPAPTAMICRTFGKGLALPCAFSLGRRTSAVNSRATSGTACPPSAALWRTASSTSARIRSFMGHAGVVSSTTSSTRSPEISIRFTMPSVTRSLCRSGSSTVLRASSTSSRRSGIVGTPLGAAGGSRSCAENARFLGRSFASSVCAMRNRESYEAIASSSAMSSASPRWPRPQASGEAERTTPDLRRPKP